MNRTGILACVCTLALASFQSGTALADAESTAARCVAKIHNTVDRSEAVISDNTQEAFRLINRLLDAGRVEAAIAVARDCVSDSRQTMRQAANYIEDVANECIRKLVRMEEYQLARRVDYARNAAFDQLTNFLERQEQALSDALGL